MTDFKTFVWNCDGLRAPTSSTPLKMGFFAKETAHTNFSLAALVETHHRSDDDLPISLTHLATHYHLIHTPAPHTDKAAGIVLLIHTSYELQNTAVLIPGRALNVLIRHQTEGTIYSVSVIYAWPGCRVRTSQIVNLVSVLHSAHSPHERNIILGDFNFVELQIDRTGQHNKGDKRYCLRWTDLTTSLRLCDPYRLQYPKRIVYSYAEAQGRSRLDRVYLSEDTLHDVLHQKYTPTPFRSTHKIYSFTIQGTRQFGPGYWKMNSSILTDVAYKTLVRDTLNKVDDFNLTDPKLWWRIFIRSIRSN